MHDRTPCHRSKVVSENLRKSKVEVLDRPENSPDLNPIENLWSYTKNKVVEKQSFSAKQLVTAFGSKKSALSTVHPW